MLGACQAVPNGIVDDPSGDPRRGILPPVYEGDAGADANGVDPMKAPDAAVDAIAADKPTTTPGEPVVDANPRVDTGPVTDPGQSIDARDIGVVLPACHAGMPCQIDLWLPGQGNCSYPVNGLPEYAAAVDRELYGQGAACGSCLEVWSNRGRVIATVVDQYPVAPGGGGHKISLSNAALLKVAAPGTSVASMNWRWVPCPVSGPIMAALKNGSHQFYWAVMLKSAVNRVVRVESLIGADTNWRAARLENDGFFLGDSTIKGLPARLRLTDTAGNTVTTGNLNWPTNPVTQTMPLDVQFPPTCTTN